MADRTMKRGNTFVFDVQVQAPVPGAPDSPLIPKNITGWKMWFTAKYYVVDPDSQAVAQLTNAPAGGIVFTEPETGKAEITMPAMATKYFPDGDVVLVYDVQVRDLDLNIFTVEDGTLTVQPHATRTLT